MLPDQIGREPDLQHVISILEFECVGFALKFFLKEPSLSFSVPTGKVLIHRV